MISSIKGSAILNNRILQLLGLVLLGMVIYLGQGILVPLGFALVLSISLLPVYRFFKRLRFPESLAIIAAILVAFIIIGVIVALISIEITSLVSNVDELQANINLHLKEIGIWIESKFGYGLKQQNVFIQQQIASLKSSGGAILQGTASSVGSLLIWFGLVPVYVYLILYYKNLLLRFVFLAIKSDHHDTVEESIYEGESTVKSYLNGLMIEMLIVGVMLFGILLLMGVKYALLIAAIFAILNMIPYVGALVANLLAVVITLSTSPHLWHTWAVLITITVVQFIDNNMIMPYLVGSKVKINAFVTVIAVVIGEALAGVGGMFLSIPAVAVMKAIFDKVDSMRHWGMLFGDDNPKLNPLSYPVMRLRKRFMRVNEQKKQQDEGGGTPTN